MSSGRRAAARVSPLVMHRLRAQLLAGPPAATVSDVVEHLLAIQAQDARGARLAVRARSVGLCARDVDAALTEDRSVVVGWLNRGTLHLVRREDYWWLHALTTPRLLTGNATRLRQEGVAYGDADRAVGVIDAALTADGPLTRAQVGERIAAAGIRTEGQALVHLLVLASLRGVTVRGPMVGAEQAFALARDWVGAPGVRDRDAALAELAVRYLRGHGPATDRDLARWAGLPLRDARRGLAAVDGRLTEHGDGLLDLAAVDRRADPPPPRLLGAFDPLLHGWVSREPILGGHPEVVVSNGMFRPFVLVNGHAVGTWRWQRDEVVLEPFFSLPRAVDTALATDARDVRRFLAGAHGARFAPATGRPGR